MWWMVVTLRPLYSREREPVSIVQEAVWAAGPVRTGVENLALTPPPPGFDPRTIRPVASFYAN